MSQEPKVIVIVLDHISRGGAETQALYLVKGLIKQNYIVHVVCFGSDKGSYWDEFILSGATLHLTNFKAKLIIPPFKSIKEYLISIKYSIIFKRFIRGLDPYIIIPFTYQPNFICNKYWKSIGVKKCIWNQRDEGRMFLGRNWEIKSLNNASNIISNSIEGKLFLENHTNRDINIIHNGVVIPNSKIDYLQNKVIRVVMIANLHGFKDHITLLKAWKIVTKNILDKKLELILAGSFGSTSENIFNFIKINEIGDTVKCIGVINDVNHLLLSSNIGVFSSKKEGLPNGILESMAVGLPVVATKINGSIEALGEDYQYLTKENDDYQMAEMIIELVNDSKKREKIGKMNRTRVKEKFAIDNMVFKYKSLIEE